MGTNFYLVHIPTEKEYEEMQELLAKRQLKELKEKIDASTYEYHIGKRSCGWQFLFSPGKGTENPHSPSIIDCNRSNCPWDNTLESLKERLANPEFIIQNEYGDTFTPEQFWEEEIKDYLYNNPETAINGEQYYKEKKNRDMYHLNTAKSEFTTKEGLRFSTTSEFC